MLRQVFFSFFLFFCVPLFAQTEDLSYEDLSYEDDYQLDETPANIQLTPTNTTINLSNFVIHSGPGDIPGVPPMTPSLPDSKLLLEIIQSNANVSNVLDLEGFGQNAYKREEFYVPSAAVGVWWRFYSQNTSIFDIPAVSEEMLVIAENGDVVWLQNIQTTSTIVSKSQRRLKLSIFQLPAAADPLWVFTYSQNSNQQKIKTPEDVANQPSFFVRILNQQGFMQMSLSPLFPEGQTTYWRYYPKKIPEILGAFFPRENDMMKKESEDKVDAEDESVINDYLELEE